MGVLRGQGFVFKNVYISHHRSVTTELLTVQNRAIFFPFLAKNGHLTKCCTLWTFRFHSSPKNIVTFCALIKPTHGYPKQDRITYVEWPKLTTYYWNQFGLFLCVCAPSIIGLVLIPSSTLPLLVEQLVTFRVGWMVWPMVCPVG